MRRLLPLGSLIAALLFVLTAGTGLASAAVLLGNDSVASLQDQDAAGLAEAFSFTAGTSGRAQSISVYVDRGSSVSGLVVGLYTDNGGRPGSLLASGSSSVPTAGEWNDVGLDSTPTLSSATTYWLALLGTGGQLSFRDSDPGTGTCSQTSAQSNLTSLPSSWTTGVTWNSCSLSADVNGTPSSATTSAPTNTAPPAISGTAEQGQSLTTSNGSWSGSPTSYTYQWEDCDTSGANCTSIRGATTSTYSLAASDVGSTLRSVVTATNAVGSTSATSIATAPAFGLLAPTASFTYSPANPVTGQSVHFDGTGSACAVSPCSYSWADDPPSGGSWPLGSGQSIDFTFVEAATKYVTLTVTDGLNRTAILEHDVIVTSTAAPVPPPAPSNSTLPAISGTAEPGQTLTTSNGSWSGSPTSVSYQWQDCSSSGASCTNISGATSTNYTLGSGDVGHTLRSVVTATNSGGATAASSLPTAVVGSGVTAPSNTAAPTVSGTRVQGSTLTTSNGSWSGSPTAFAYRWQDCNTSGTGCANIAGATSSSYTLQASDVGNTVRSTVSASNSAGSASATSAAGATIIASSGGGGGGGGGSSSYTCTQHVTTSTFSAAFSNAGAGAVLCLAPGSYGSLNGSSKSSMVVITPDVSAGATAPTGNASGDVNGNVTFSGADFSPAANITMDGVTFTGDVSVSGASHDLLLHDSLFHQHLVITDPTVSNPHVTASYDMFPADKADCVGGPEGRIWLKGNGGSTPDGVTIENSNIGGPVSQCDGIQTGAYGPQILNNWIHDFHYASNAHTDGIQDYGGSHEVVKGNFMYNVPDCYVSYDGTNHADVENNICVNDGSQNNGGSPNDLDILGDTSSIIKHNTVVAFKDAYNSPAGCITLGSKGQSSTGTSLTDNIATCLVTDSNGNSASYTESHNMWVSSGPSGSGDLHGTATYAGGSCASLTSSQPPFCSDSWSNYLLTPSSVGNNAADDGTDMGAYGPGPVTPGGPA